MDDEVQARCINLRRKMTRDKAQEFMPSYTTRGKKGRRALLRLLWSRVNGTPISQKAIDLQERSISNG